MIDYIKGSLTYIQMNFLVIEAHGVGYQIYMSNPYSLQRSEGEVVTVYTYQHVREDILALYGFSTRQERELFEKLLLVSGVGPKGALAILSAGTPAQLIYAIQTEDIGFLTRLPGIGKKTAQRLILDLKDKLEDIVGQFTFSPAETLFPIEAKNQKKVGKAYSKELQEAIDALLSLGYTQKEIDSITPTLKEEGLEKTDQMIKLGLQLLMK